MRQSLHTRTFLIAVTGNFDSSPRCWPRSRRPFLRPSPVPAGGWNQRAGRDHLHGRLPAFGLNVVAVLRRFVENFSSPFISTSQTAEGGVFLAR